MSKLFFKWRSLCCTHGPARLTLSSISRPDQLYQFRPVLFLRLTPAYGENSLQFLIDVVMMGTFKMQIVSCYSLHKIFSGL